MRIFLFSEATLLASTWVNETSWPRVLPAAFPKGGNDWLEKWTNRVLSENCKAVLKRSQQDFDRGMLTTWQRGNPQIEFQILLYILLTFSTRACFLMKNLWTCFIFVGKRRPVYLAKDCIGPWVSSRHVGSFCGHLGEHILRSLWHGLSLEEQRINFFG